MEAAFAFLLYAVAIVIVMMAVAAIVGYGLTALLIYSLR